jgi:hypothetical protein
MTTVIININDATGIHTISQTTLTKDPVTPRLSSFFTNQNGINIPNTNPPTFPQLSTNPPNQHGLPEPPLALELPRERVEDDR